MRSGNSFIDTVISGQKSAPTSNSRISQLSESIQHLSRRDFLRLTSITAGSGLILSACATGGSANKAAEACVGDDVELNVYMRVACDNTVTFTLHRSEMGQGARTGLAQVFAEDLDVEWSELKFEQALGNKKYGEQNTDGSRTIRKDFYRLRKLSATANYLLRVAAAQYWELDVSEVYTQKGMLKNTKNRKKATYGDMAELASTITVPEDKDIVLKPISEWQYISNASLKSIDIDSFVKGDATYGYDVDVPDMVYASIERCPTLLGKLVSCDDSEARKVPGVIDIVHLKQNTVPILFQPWHGVAIVATNTWAAMQAREKLVCEWDHGVNASHNSQAYYKTLTDRVQQPARVSNRRGDAMSVLDASDNTHEAVYTTPYIPHAPMEPPAATAFVQGDTCEVWAATQAPQGVMANVSGAIGIPEENVKVNVTFLGGGFGRKSKPDFSVEAAVISKQVGKPVKVCWKREDELKHGYYHAISAQYFKASLDDNSGVDAWLQRTAFPSIGSTFNPNYGETNDGGELGLGFDEMPLGVPNLQHENGKSEAYVRIGWFRSVSNIHHAFARSSFIDELAHKTNTHPLTFLENIIGPDRIIEPEKEDWKHHNYWETFGDHPMSTARLKHVARKAVELSGFDTELPEGEGWGLSAHRSFVSYVAAATKVKVVGDKVSVEEVHCVIDCGIAVNPDRIRSQMEGAVIMGMTLSMLGELTVTDGVVDQGNFDTYPLLRIPQCPAKVHVHIVESEANPGGVGEPGLPPIAPSITNAIYAATGKRIRALPISKHFTI